MRTPTSCPAFVGRSDELELLESLLDEATSLTTTVLIGGEAGIGKSRLIGEVADRARRRGALVAFGACVPMADGGLPFGPVVGILRELVRLTADHDAESVLAWLTGVDDLRPARPDPQVPLVPSETMSYEWAKTRLFESVLSCFTALGKRSPMVVIFEDLQWADSASAELIGFLTRNLDAVPLLIVGTYRAEEIGAKDHRLRPWLAELARHRRATLMQLAGLGRAEIGELIAGIIGQDPEWALVDAVWARSQGNAFFAEELTAARHSQSLSAELTGVVMGRVESLSDDAQQLLRLAATIGARFEHGVLSAASGVQAEALDRVVEELVDRQILVVDDERVGYRFRHMLLREAVEQSLLPGQRARLHLQVANALAGDELADVSSSRRTAELAAHWWAAGEWGQAFESSLRAADTACDVWAFPEAHALLERALDALDRRRPRVEDVPVDRMSLLVRTAHAAYLAGANHRAMALIQAAIHLTDISTEPATAATLYSLLGRNALAIGDSDTAFNAFRRAVELLPSGPPSVDLARVLAEEARGLLVMSKIAAAHERSREAIEVARAAGARAEEGHALNTQGCCLAALGRSTEGIALVREALAIAEDIGSPEDLNRAYGNLSALLMDAGRPEEATALVFDSVAMGEELLGVRLEAAASNGAACLVRLGRYADAATLLSSIGERGIGACPAGPTQTKATLAIRRGRFDEADSLLSSIDVLTSAFTDVQQRAVFWVSCAELALERGRPDEAFGHIQHAVALAADTDEIGARVEILAVAIRCLADGNEARLRNPRFDDARASEAAGQYVDLARRLSGDLLDGGPTRNPRVAAMLSTCVAEHSRLTGYDAETWARTAPLWDAVCEPHPAAYCRWREAEALLEQRADRSRADEVLQTAWRVASELGAAPLIERIERLAKRARIDLRHIDDLTPSRAATIAADLRLTMREVEVLVHLASGRTDREIAESLFISKKTASVHVSNLLRKLHVASRVEAGKIGQLHGL